MSELRFRSDMDVELIDVMGDDKRVALSARVSTGKDRDVEGSVDGLINYLMRERHGSPFEHVVYTFRISAPIFVAREFMRHRIASYNEESGRYKTLDPVFYVPDESRPLIQTGKVGHYVFEHGDLGHGNAMRDALIRTSVLAYGAYQEMLDAGIAREVARMCLPVNIYTSWYVTMNARGLMNFLSLRTKDPKSSYPSYPQHEIEQVAIGMEEHFSHATPAIAYAWDSNGRVAP